MADGNDRDDAKPHYHGHRQRLRARFMATGGDGMPDYEMLELLLALAIPRRDVKPLAKALLDKFGNYAGVIAAEPGQLTAVKGMGDGAVAALKLAQASAVRLLRQRVLRQDVLSSWDQLIDYCSAAMAHEKVEQLRLLFLDRKNVLIADEVQQRGTVDHTPLYTREVVKRTLELGATALIVVHNHPSGDPTPSQGDIKMTRELQEALGKIGITLHDHLVIGRDGHESFRARGLL
ncbi:MAG: DNA repair protein RadC [Alphaproteobacteria bacterium]|nr:DNA repair protein RadC [Alphaproteobacteria bacterium]